MNFTAATVPVISHTVTLTWAPSSSSGVVGYNVYQATASGGPYIKMTLSPAAALSFIDTNVSGGQTYFYVATALDESMTESAFSEQGVAQVPI